MASIHRQKGKANWFCAFTNFDGSRCFKSSGTPERARARLIADTMQRMVDMARRQDITIDRAKEAIAATLKRMESDGCPRFYAEQAREVLQEIADAILQGVGLQLPKASIRAFMDSWKRDKQASTAPATFHRYEVVVNKFLKHLDKKADRSVAALSAEEIRAWRDQIIPTISPASVNLHLKILRVALADAGREQLIERNVATLVPMLKTSKDAIRRAFTLPELKKLLTVANGEWRTMILTGLYTGLRMQDIATLTWANLDLQAGELTVVTNKTGRTQALPIAKPLMRHLETLPAGDDPKAPLCPALNGFDSGILSNQFHGIMVSAGLVKERSYKTNGKGRAGRRQTSEISFHCLRHTATSLLKNAGVSDVVARDIIGHESEAISRTYTHIETETKRKALDRMPDVLADKTTGEEGGA